MNGFRTGQNLSVLIPTKTPAQGNLANEPLPVASLNITVTVTWDDGVELSQDLVQQAERSIMQSAAAAYAELDKRLREQTA